MIKRSEVIYSEKRKGEIIGNIMMDLDFNPPLTWDYLTKFEKVIDSPKRFIGHIRHDEVSLQSKGLIYWPKTKVELESENGQTVIKVTYESFRFYTGLYLFLTIPFLTSFLVNVIDRGLKYDENTGVPLFFLAVLLMIPLFGRWLQKNTVKYLTNF